MNVLLLFPRLPIDKLVDVLGLLDKQKTVLKVNSDSSAVVNAVPMVEDLPVAVATSVAVDDSATLSLPGTEPTASIRST